MGRMAHGPRLTTSRETHMDECPSCDSALCSDAPGGPANILFGDGCADCTDEDGNVECPYCSRPEGWDACPVHRNGT